MSNSYSDEEDRLDMLAMVMRVAGFLEGVSEMLNPIKRILKSSKTWLAVSGGIVLALLRCPIEDIGKYVAFVVPLVIIGNTSEDVSKKIGEGLVRAIEKLITLKQLMLLLVLIPIFFTTGCFMDNVKVRVERVHISDNPTADVCIQYKNVSYCVSVEVEKIIYETTTPTPTIPAAIPLRPLRFELAPTGGDL